MAAIPPLARRTILEAGGHLFPFTASQEESSNRVGLPALGAGERIGVS